MAYKLRFVQYFDKSDTNAFLTLEQKFIALEKQDASMACGKRYVSVMGREPTNTMVWEAEFETMKEAVSNLEKIETSSEHDKLLDEQIRFMRDAYVEIYKEL